MRTLADDPGVDFRLAVNGMHLSPEFGSTWREIAVGRRVGVEGGVAAEYRDRNVRYSSRGRDGCRK